MRSEKIKPHQTTFLQIKVLISYRFYITGISNYTSFLLWQMCIFSFFSQVGLISPHPLIYTNSFRFSTYYRGGYKSDGIEGKIKLIKNLLDFPFFL